jgi:signal transduction histidine kinase
MIVSKMARTGRCGDGENNGSGRRSTPVITRPEKVEMGKPAVSAKGTHEDVTAEAKVARAETLNDDDVIAIAHDVKNPLSVIMLETMVLEERLGDRISPAVQSGLERIAHNATYIDRLISDLLDLASTDAGEFELRTERCDLTRLLAAAVERAVTTADRGHIRIDLDDNVYANVDAMRIERVVSNLVANAIKHGKPPVIVRLLKGGQCATVEVIDAGPGLTSVQTRTVFERYQRGERQRDGYGLGLYISRKIIEAHRGRIGVESSAERGSRFFFEIPAL